MIQIRMQELEMEHNRTGSVYSQTDEDYWREVGMESFKK